MAPKPAAAQIEQCSDDRLEFEWAVREHQGLVYSMAYHFLGNRAVAEELAQEVFLSLYRNFSNIKSGSHLVFWLRKVTSHRCLDYIRGQKHRAHLSLEEVREKPVSHKDPDPLMSGHLRRMVGSLPEKARMVVVLRYQEDLTPTEIAEILEMPVNSVKSHLRRSLALLREKMSSRLRNESHESHE
jgi:RNA polymerase sigma-70 factor, ECF subfamily